MEHSPEVGPANFSWGTECSFFIYWFTWSHFWQSEGIFLDYFTTSWLVLAAFKMTFPIKSFFMNFSILVIISKVQDQKESVKATKPIFFFTHSNKRMWRNSQNQFVSVVFWHFTKFYIHTKYVFVFQGNQSKYKMDKIYIQIYFVTINT